MLMGDVEIVPTPVLLLSTVTGIVTPGAANWVSVTTPPLTRPRRSMPRVVTFGDIKLAPQKDVGLKFEATLHTYRYLDEEELNAAAPKPAAKGGKK